MKEAIEKRRAYRSLEPVKITENLIEDLAESARLAPSCFNYQPWQYVFVYDEETLVKIHEALSQGNEWAHHASMIIAVFSKKDDDCVIKEREYYLFDPSPSSSDFSSASVFLGLSHRPSSEEPS